MSVEQNQLEASKTETWNQFTRLLFWGSVFTALLVIVAVYFTL